MITTTQQISLRIPTYMVDRLRAEARRLSYQLQREIVYTDLVREALHIRFSITPEELPPHIRIECE